MQLMPLYAAERNTLLVSRQESVVRKVDTEQAMGVAADRVFRDSERWAEHSRLGQVAAAGRRECEYEVAGRAQLRRQCGQPAEVRFEMFERFFAAHANQKARAARSDDTQRAARVEVIRCERKRVEYGEAFAIVQLATHGGGA